MLRERTIRVSPDRGLGSRGWRPRRAPPMSPGASRVRPRAPPPARPPPLRASGTSRRGRPRGGRGSRDPRRRILAPCQIRAHTSVNAPRAGCGLAPNARSDSLDLTPAHAGVSLVPVASFSRIRRRCLEPRGAERMRWERHRRTGDRGRDYRGRDYRYGRGSYDRHRAAADHSG